MLLYNLDSHEIEIQFSLDIHMVYVCLLPTLSHSICDFIFCPNAS